MIRMGISFLLLVSDVRSIRAGRGRSSASWSMQLSRVEGNLTFGDLACPG